MTSQDGAKGYNSVIHILIGKNDEHKNLPQRFFCAHFVNLSNLEKNVIFSGHEHAIFFFVLKIWGCVLCFLVNGEDKQDPRGAIKY